MGCSLALCPGHLIPGDEANLDLVKRVARVLGPVKDHLIRGKIKDFTYTGKSLKSGRVPQHHS